MSGSRVRLWIGRLAVAAVAAAVVAALCVMGSPAEARRRKNDEQRVEDLVRLVAEVRKEASVLKALPPPSFAIELKGGIDPLEDPVTRKPYHYRPLGPDAFEVGAVFEAPGVRRRYFDVEQRRLADHPAGPKRFVVPLKRDDRR